MAKKEQISLEKLAQKMDRRFDFVDKKLNNQDSRSDTFVKAILNLIDDTKDIKENMATAKDIDNINTTLDKHTIILKKLDQERLASIQRMNRQEDEIIQVKKFLKI